MKKQIDVTAAIIIKNNKVFAARRKAGNHLAGYWEFPGGKLEAGETLEQCLARELQEEFNISTQVGHFIGESVYDYSTKVVRLSAYKVEHLAGEFQLNDHDELRWLALDELDTVQWAPADIPLVEQYKVMAATMAYYNNNAQKYCEETRTFQVDELYQSFLGQLSKGAHILDLGCGSGRDSKAFLSEGYIVTPVDGSTEIAAYAEHYLGQSVEVTSFQELDYHDTFDGVWASASLLHCPRIQLPGVLVRIVRALKVDGVAYMSFKWGECDSVDSWGRHFTNVTEASLRGVLDQMQELSVIHLWSETKPLRDGEQQWVNVLVRKVMN